ncbi:translation initiation factor eIF-2B subunit beta [Lingula anatina]|uniref:Translation initiation factor eIF2B subunit beta n=1 Tax=Lingula anatina TaxID=7574 RepID=A0A1S3HHL1_LINAN|nr:translation initiation factor eIF-2B subunit beta [Lingula anatina]|eukprot:XP_013385512.1 translation initiation factor eIF-2B subunit beta [Lingula anatina]
MMFDTSFLISMVLRAKKRPCIENRLADQAAIMPSESEKMGEFQEKLDTFINDLKQGHIQGSYTVAHNTVHILRGIISNMKWRNASEVMSLICKEGKKIIDAQPSESAAGNMVRRVLKIIREESASVKGKHEDGEAQESLHNLLLAEGQIDYSHIGSHSLKAPLIEAIGELITELETSADNIAVQALEHIHANEIVLTAGKSRTVEAFLVSAAKKRRFQVIVVECAPFYHGQELAVKLANAGIETTVITDSAVFAMMSRVNKVIIGTHTVMANGGLKAINGSHAIALAAKHHSVPLIVCAPMFKLSPQYLCSYDQDAFNKFVSPHDVMKFSEGEILSHAQIQNPVFDYVPPELVTLFISNIGGNAPSYVYRLLSELYHPDDHYL